MAADFWAGYISGAAGIIVGNPLDIVKVRLQNGNYKLDSHLLVDVWKGQKSQEVSDSGAAALNRIRGWIRGLCAFFFSF
jgi:hypothetical protein